MQAAANTRRSIRAKPAVMVRSLKGIGVRAATKTYHIPYCSNWPASQSTPSRVIPGILRARSMRA